MSKDYESGKTYMLRLTSVDIAVTFDDTWDKEQAHEAIADKVSEVISNIVFFDGNNEIENEGDACADASCVEDHT